MTADFAEEQTYKQDSQKERELNDATERALERLNQKKAAEMSADFDAEERRKREEAVRLRREEDARVEHDTVSYLRRSGRKEMIP